MIYKALERLIRKTRQILEKGIHIRIHGRLAENRNRTTSESFCKLSFQWGLLPGQWCFWSHQPAWQAARLARLPSKPKEAPMADVPTWQAHARQALGSALVSRCLKHPALLLASLPCESGNLLHHGTHDKTHDKLHICMLCSSLLSHYSRYRSRSRTQSRHLPLKLFDLSLDLSTTFQHTDPWLHHLAFPLNGHVENLTPAAESAWACPCKKTLYWIFRN